MHTETNFSICVVQITFVWFFKISPGSNSIQQQWICSSYNKINVEHIYFKHKIGSMRPKDLDISSKCIADSMLLN